MKAPGFLDLPGEIRDEVYDKLLHHQDPINLTDHLLSKYSYGFAHHNRSLLDLYPQIALLNKQINSEATAVLYGKNHFMIADVDNFARFLDKIGWLNANLLQHLDISFPDFHNDGHHIGITLQEDCEGLRALKMIQDKCHNMSIVEMTLGSSHFIEARLDECDPNTVNQVLQLVDEQLRMIISLRKVIIHLYNDPVNIDIREKMNKSGWIIKTEELKDWESDGSWDDDEFAYGFDYFGYDDYDGHRRRFEETNWWEDFHRRNDSD